MNSSRCKNEEDFTKWRSSSATLSISRYLLYTLHRWRFLHAVVSQISKTWCSTVHIFIHRTAEKKKTSQTTYTDKSRNNILWDAVSGLGMTTSLCPQYSQLKLQVPIFAHIPSQSNEAKKHNEMLRVRLQQQISTLHNARSGIRRMQVTVSNILKQLKQQNLLSDQANDLLDANSDILLQLFRTKKQEGYSETKTVCFYFALLQPGTSISMFFK